MRRTMVQEQIELRGIRDPLVLRAMNKVPRHHFVPQKFQTFAYEDQPLPIGEGQTISQPYIVAFMTEQLKLKGGEKVLEIGTGSGYQAAVLSEIVSQGEMAHRGKVYTIEIIPPLSHQAQQVLKSLGYQNIFFRIGNGYFGWKEEAPFDAIIVTAAPEEVPQPLIDQLKEGGRMIIPVGSLFQNLLILSKTKGGVIRKVSIPVRFVPLVNEPTD